MATPFPPHQIHSTTQLSQSQARELISDYLQRSKTDLFLHPNALLTENGPITPSGGSNAGLVLHNLKRLKYGMRPKRAATEPALQEEGKKKSVSEEDGVRDGANSHGGAENGMEDPMDVDQKGERISEPRHALARRDTEQRLVEPHVRRKRPREVPKVEVATTVTGENQRDREARKKAKKAKRKDAALNGERPLDNAPQAGKEQKGGQQESKGRKARKQEEKRDSTTTDQQPFHETPEPSNMRIEEADVKFDRNAQKRIKEKGAVNAGQASPLPMPPGGAYRGDNVDKEARKKAKKERQKQLKREVAERQQRERNAER